VTKPATETIVTSNQDRQSMTQAEGNVHIIKSNANSMFSTLKGSLLDLKPKSAVRKPAK